MAEQESILRIKIDSRNAEKNANSLNKELQSIEKNGDFASKSMDSMSVATRQLAGYMAGIVTISSAIAMADGYTQMAARIRNATSSAQEYELVQDRILETAKTTFRSLSEAQEVYLSLSGGMRSLGKSTNETLDLVDSLSFSFTHNATRTDQAQSAMDSLSKSMAKGKIDADAWISIVTGADNIIADMAKTTGKTEAEIRKLGAEGKASLEDLIKTLIATREQNEKLANNMENSLADGLTNLTTAVTVYLGKANEATGATGLLAGGLGILADNLESVANIAMLGGIALVTKAITTKTIAVYDEIGATIKKREADALAIQSQIQLAGLELQRTRQVQALALTELNLARQELNSATTRQARAAATMRLTQAEIAHNITLKQTAASTAALNLVESQLNKTRGLGAGALALVGGWAGAATLGITALSAAYMLFSDSTKESTESLRENNESVSDAIAKYKELTLAKQQSQAVAEREELSKLGDKYSDLSDKLNTATYAFSRNNDMTREQSIQVNALVAEYKKTNDLEQFSKKVNALTFISEDSKNKFNTLAGSVKDAGDKFREQRTFIEQMNAVLNNTKSAGDNAAAGIRNAAAALNEINTKLSGDVFAAKLQNAYEKQGKSAQSAARWTQIQLENAKKGFKGVTVEQKKMLDQLDAVDKQREARQKAQSDANKAQAKASKDASAQAKKDTKIAEDNAETRKQIAYSYSDDIKQIYLNLDRELADIEKSGAGEVYAQKARDRARYEEEIYLRSFTEQINSFRWSEEEKLNYSIDTQKLIADESGKYNDDIKKIVMDNLEEERAYELANIKLAKEQRIFQAEQAFLSESVFIKRKYELERQEIAKTRDEQERNALMTASFINEGNDTAKAQQSAAQGLANALGIDYSLEEQLQQKRDAIIAYREWFEMTEDEFQTAILEAQDSYEKAKLQLQLSYGEQITGSFASMFGTMMGEQSRAYKLMFAAEKAFAIASAIINIQSGIAKASALAFPYNLAAMATVASQTASIVSNIKAVADVGFQSGGYTGNGGVSEIAGVVHGKEYVLNAEATKRVGVGTLNAINNGASVGGGITVNIVNNGTPQSYDVQQIDENTVKIIATDIVNQEVTRQLSAPNSPISKGIKQNFNTSNRRG